MSVSGSTNAQQAYLKLDSLSFQTLIRIRGGCLDSAFSANPFHGHLGTEIKGSNVNIYKFMNKFKKIMNFISDARSIFTNISALKR